MDVVVRAFEERDLEAMRHIWNQVVEDGVAFPQEECLTLLSARDFFESQTFTGVAVSPLDGRVVGLYILHPNNVGRCGHICNASYAVDAEFRGRHIGEQLVRHCIEQSRKCGFRILQFNAVVSNNYGALHLYERLGFVRLGTIPGGFRMVDGTYQDIIPHYLKL